MKKINEFEKNSGILFILIMCSNVCNYLFQIIIGRMVNVSDFGTINSLLSIISIFSLPATIVTMITARYISVGKAVKDIGRMAYAFHFMMEVTFVLAGGILLIGIFLSPIISKILQIENLFYVFYSMLIASIFLLNAPLCGTFQGMQNFIKYGIQTCIPSVFKLVLGIILVESGFRVFGAISGIMIGNMIAIVYSGTFVYREFGLKRDYKRSKRWINMDLREFVSGTIIAQLCITLVSNGDILLVKAFFSSEEAGIYSSGMVIGKISMYISSAIVATLFPIITERNEKGLETNSFFVKALFYGGGASILCSIGMSLFGSWIIGILFGENYKAGIALLPFISVYIIPITFLTIIMNYVLAKCKGKFFSISMIAGILGGMLIAIFIHSSVKIMILGIGGVMWLIVALNLMDIYVRERKEK